MRRPDRLSRWLLPYRDVARGDIVVFHHPQPPFLVKRVVGIPGDRLRIEDGRVTVNGVAQDEPYAAFEPAASNPFRDDFPAACIPIPRSTRCGGARCRALLTTGSWLSRQGEYFVLGDNRNHSLDSRFWGFVPRSQIVARPLVIYFSLKRPSTTDVQQAADDRLGHDRELSARLIGFARWKRIFHVIH